VKKSEGSLLTKRFWAKVKKRKSGCWEWTACLTDGYGIMTVRGSEHPSGVTRAQLAHRVSWFLHTGKWPHKHILHHCDNRPCIRPKHLYEGTDVDNARDREERGNTTAILTAAKVKVIRLSRLPDRIWAKRFGVTKSTIACARAGKSWTHIKNPPPIRRHRSFSKIE